MKFIRAILIRFGRPPEKCPYCKGSIGWGAGRWECNNCDAEGSY